ILRLMPAGLLQLVEGLALAPLSVGAVTDKLDELATQFIVVLRAPKTHS
ncbi:unnamed protein product, partial [marine sediment metagenome]